MQVVVVLLLVASLALLVSGLITGGTPLVVVSILTSLLAGYLISRYRNRQPATGTSRRRPTAAPADPSAASAGRSGASAGKPAAPAVAAGRPAAPPASVAGRPAAPSAGLASSAPVPPAGPVPGALAPVPASAGVAGLEPAAQSRTEPVGRHSQEARCRAEQDEPDGDDPPVAETDPPLRSRGDEPVWVIDGRPRYHLAECGFLLDREPEPVSLRQAVEDGFTPCALCDPDSGLVAAANRS